MFQYPVTNLTFLHWFLLQVFPKLAAFSTRLKTRPAVLLKPWAQVRSVDFLPVLDKLFYQEHYLVMSSHLLSIPHPRSAYWHFLGHWRIAISIHAPRFPQSGPRNQVVSRFRGFIFFPHLLKSKNAAEQSFFHRKLPPLLSPLFLSSHSSLLLLPLISSSYC